MVHVRIPYLTLTVCIISNNIHSCLFIPCLKGNRKDFSLTQAQGINHKQSRLHSMSNLKSKDMTTNTEYNMKDTESELIPAHFVKNNIYSCKTVVPHNHRWGRLLPKAFSSSSNGIDISVTFSNIDTGAHELIHRCNLFREEEKNSIEYNDTLKYLQGCLNEFYRFLPNKKYTVRIVSSKGKRGQKCPRWHSDHVAVRLILSLHGPGVCYTSSTNFHAESYVNTCSEFDTDKANKIIEKEFGNNIQCFDTGDCVILMGKQWGKHGNPAAIHRSPNIIPFQGRVLMTMDVIED